MAVETVATGEALHALVRAVRRRGTIVLKSRPFEPVPLDVSSAVDKELTLRAVRYAAFEDAIARLASRSLVVDDLLGETFPLERFEDAFAAARRESTKPLFAIGGS
jgi:threonine dehydrogenase-like Zn-dependent dehydrogenase